jgi:histidine triad (HIT) family protein
MRDCVFCDHDRIVAAGSAVIRNQNLFLSFTSNPGFRDGHVLVIPRRHVEKIDKLTDDESAAIMAEIGRLSKLFDCGFGTGLMQKFQPTQSENDVKVNHLHFHVFPRVENERGLFPVPEPNSFDGFHLIDKVEAERLADSLKDVERK